MRAHTKTKRLPNPTKHITRRVLCKPKRVTKERKHWHQRPRPRKTFQVFNRAKTVSKC